MYFVILYQIRRKFRSQTSDNMDRWKSRGGKSQGREAKEKEVQRRERVRRKKMQVGEKVEKSWNTVFSIISGPGGSKSRLAKAAGAEPSGQMRDEKLHPHVARSTSPSQNVQNTPTPEHFWKLRCRKSARRCGTKNMSKSKCTKHFSFAALFRNWDVKKVHGIVARSTFRSQHEQNTPCSEQFWKLMLACR